MQRRFTIALAASAAAAAGLAAPACSVKVQGPSSIPYVEVFEVAGFGDEEQDYGETLLRADSDGDGVDELIVGAPSRDPEYDGVVLFVSLYDFEVVNVLAPFRDPAEDSEHHDEFGRALAIADWNGDGKLDVVVGDPGADLDGAGGDDDVEQAGEAWAYFGPLDLTEPVRLRADAPRTGDRFGATLATGDFDGDGFADLAVGAPHPAEVSAGADDASVTVWFGPDLVRRETWTAAGGGGDFGAALIPAPTEAGAATLVVGAPEATSDGDAFVWQREQGPGAPIRLNPAAPADARCGRAGGLGDFDGDGRLDLALVAPRGRGGVYFFDPGALERRGSLAMPGALSERQGAPVARFPDVSRDGADELVLLSATCDEFAAVLFSPGCKSGHLRLDFAASAAVTGNFDFDEEDELLLATPTSFHPTGGFSLLRVVDFSWQPVNTLRTHAPPAVIPGITSLRPTH